MLNNNELINQIKSYNKFLNSESLSKAYDFALEAHQNQKREEGVPYIIHPVAVAKILTELKLDSATITTGLLHDTIEDTKVTYETVKKEFGEEVVLYINRVDRRPERNQTYIQSDSQVLSGSTENIPPTVEDIILNIERNTIHNIQLRFVDADGGPGPYEITIIEGPEHGVLSGVGNDRIFQPTKNFRGKDQFTWKVNDGKDDSQIGRVELIIK